MLVCNHMTTCPTTLAPSQTAYEAYDVMKATGFRRVPVIDARNELVGMIAQSDLDDLYEARGPVASHIPICDVMAVDPIAIDESATLSDAMSLFQTYPVSALPVTREERTLVGIITKEDVLEAQARALGMG